MLDHRTRSPTVLKRVRICEKLVDIERLNLRGIELSNAQLKQVSHLSTLIHLDLRNVAQFAIQVGESWKIVFYLLSNNGRQLAARFAADGEVKLV